MRYFILMLLLCGVCLGAVPIYEYNADDTALQCMRSSAAVKEDYVNGFSDLVEYEKNTKQIVLSSIVEPFISSDAATPNDTYNCIDSFNDRILVWNGYDLKHTVDAVTFTTIISTNLINTPVGNTMASFQSDLFAAGASSVTRRVLPLSATSALVAIGSDDLGSPYAGGTELGRMYLTTDSYATFTQILATDYGRFYFGEPFNDGQYLLAGVYHGGANRLPLTQTVYASFDAGANWVIVDQVDNTGLTEDAHTHFARFYDNDTIVISCGDGLDARFIRKVTRPSSWDGTSVWDLEWSKFAYMTTSEFIFDDNYMYISSEASSGRTFSVLKYDMELDTSQVVLQVPKIADSGGTAYNFSSGRPSSNTMLKYNGIFYTGFHDFNNTEIEGGLYASPDGVNWVCVYRGEYGVRRVYGGFGSEIVCTINVSGTDRMALFPTPSLRRLNAIVVEKAAANQISEYAAASNSNWGSSSNLNQTSITTGQLYPSENALLLEPTSSANGSINSQFSTSTPGVFPDRIVEPTANDYAFVSFDIKSDNLAEVLAENLKYLEFELNLTGVPSGVNYQRIYPTSSGWTKIVMAFHCTSPLSAKIGFYFKHNLEGSVATALTNANIYIQNLQIYYDVERYDTRSYTPKTLTKSDDFSIAPLTGLSSAWSVTFEWLPLNGNLAFPAGIVDTLPIATIKGSEGKYIKLYWDRTTYDGAGGGMAFKLTDGSNTVSLDTEQSAAMSWLHNDILKFGITSNGTITYLYCFNPESGGIQGSAILSNSGSAILDIPTNIMLGTNEDETVIGTGAFANIRGFDSVLSSGDIESVFNSVNDLILQSGSGIFGPKQSIFGGL